MQTLATADINDVGVGGSHGDGADRLRRLAIEDGVPSAAVVIRLPDAAIYLADIKHIGLSRDAAGGARAPAAKRANHAPLQVLVSIFGNLRPACDCGENYDHRRD